MHSTLIIGETNRSHSVHKSNFTNKKRDTVPHAIIPC